MRLSTCIATSLYISKLFTISLSDGRARAASITQLFSQNLLSQRNAPQVNGNLRNSTKGSPAWKLAPKATKKSLGRFGGMESTQIWINEIKHATRDYDLNLPVLEMRLCLKLLIRCLTPSKESLGSFGGMEFDQIWIEEIKHTKSRLYSQATDSGDGEKIESASHYVVPEANSDLSKFRRLLLGMEIVQNVDRRNQACEARL